MTHIYALVSGQLVLYVGKTKLSLKRRESCHRCKKSNRCSSKYIPEYIDWTMKLLETVADDKAIEKEQHYYDTLKPLYNYQRPGQTTGEYEQTEACKESKRKYEQSEARKEVNRKYKQSEAGKKARNKAQRKYRLKKKSEAPVDATKSMHTKLQSS